MDRPGGAADRLAALPSTPASKAQVTAAKYDRDSINRLEAKLSTEYRQQVSSQIYEHSVAYGRTVAGVILMWAATDGYSIQNNCRDFPTSAAGAWRPTPPSFNPEPLQPCWGKIRPMVLTSGQEMHREDSLDLLE